MVEASSSRECFALLLSKDPGIHVQTLIFKWFMQGESLWRKDQGQLLLAWHPNPCLQLEQAACIQCQQEQPGELAEGIMHGAWLLQLEYAQAESAKIAATCFLSLCHHIAQRHKITWS